MYHKILLISGGSMEDVFAKKWMSEYEPDYIIAADSGMEFLYRIGQKPDMIIGDFDSVRPQVLAYFKEQDGIVFKELNPVKDDTDTEFAIRQALILGTEEITILGGTGNRIDHVLGNVSLLGIGLRERVRMQMLDGHNRIRMIDKPVRIKKEEQFGTYVSLLPYSSRISHLFLKGFKYPLEDFTMEPFSSIGISNEIIEQEAEILFEDGILLVIEARD